MPYHQTTLFLFPTTDDSFNGPEITKILSLQLFLFGAEVDDDTAMPLLSCGRPVLHQASFRLLISDPVTRLLLKLLIADVIQLFQSLVGRSAVII